MEAPSDLSESYLGRKMGVEATAQRTYLLCTYVALPQYWDGTQIKEGRTGAMSLQATAEMSLPWIATAL